MNYSYKNKLYKITRYPTSENRSLQAWSAVDEHLLKYLDDINVESKKNCIYNDRFGFLSCLLNQHSPTTIVNYRSQEKSCRINLTTNNLKISEEQFVTPLSKLSKPFDIVLIKIPKSIELFKLYLNQLSKSIVEDTIVICGFMTKYFSPQMLEVTKDYFEEVEQSKAWKKSRLIILGKKKKNCEANILNTIRVNEKKVLKQYLGVFSAKNIDYATQFLLEHLEVKEDDNIILDLASGNGVIASSLRDIKPKSKIHLLDDSFLAIESSKINLQDKNTSFHYNDSLDDFEDDFFDLVVSNPPFHFEYENNIEISIGLFKEVKRCLKENGRFLLVSSKHLNLKTHLIKLFREVKIIAENKKFEIYKCNL
ncbi:MAG: methyltransferase [Ignavibacteriae bacterium]|nr:methyltransferase [Ignavibacteriota bacterium]